MRHDNLLKLADRFINGSLQVKSGENIRVEYGGPKAYPLAKVCATIVEDLEAHPYMVDIGCDATTALIGKMSEEEIMDYGQRELAEVKKLAAYVRVGDEHDWSRIKLPGKLTQLWETSGRAAINYKVNNLRRMITRAPTEELAHDCGMEMKKFEEFYLNVCLMNYDILAEAMKPLQEILENGREIRIISPRQETDIVLNKGDVPVVPCIGIRNIPDGECYTAPVKNSVNGSIRFISSTFNGETFPHIKLFVKDGRIENAEAGDIQSTKALNNILDIDEGSRYFGEFSFGLNPFIENPTGIILFDEKINGSIHMAVGTCYERASNGNRSAIHWDLIQIQRPEFGGGEIWIDDKLVRKDGLFVIPELKPLNPSNLIRAVSFSSKGGPAL